MKKRKIKIFGYGDSPACPSGFGNVFKNIWKYIYKTGLFEITHFGINHIITKDEFGREKGCGLPYDVLDARYLSPHDIEKGFRYDVMGTQKLAQIIVGEEIQFDLFFTIHDINTLDKVSKFFEAGKFRKDFKTILYFPFDCHYFPPHLLEILTRFDSAVPYAKFSEALIKKTDPSTPITPPIPHGANIDEFYPISNGIMKKRRKEIFGDKNKFVLLNVNTASQRKDPSRSLFILKETQKHIPEAVLYMHCDPTGDDHHLPTIMDALDLKKDIDVFFTKGKENNANKGQTIEEMNEIYNLGDVLISTTMGEGWGLSSYDAMCCKIPVILPDNTTAREIIGDNEERGYLAKSGTDYNLMYVYGKANCQPPRPLTDVYDMVNKIVHIYKNPQEAKDKTEKAYLHTREQSWENIVKRYWLPLFIEQAKNLGIDI